MQRFWNKVEKTDGCWLWTASTFTDGYGKFKFDGKNRRAHRMSWIMENGEIPDGMVVLHSCDTPLCVNPAHLSLGTPKDNTQDMIKKNRQHNQIKTHCPRGHEYDIANKNGSRACRNCRNEAWRKMYARRKAKVNS